MSRFHGCLMDKVPRHVVGNGNSHSIYSGMMVLKDNLIIIWTAKDRTYHIIQLTIIYYYPIYNPFVSFTDAINSLLTVMEYLVLR